MGSVFSDLYSRGAAGASAADLAQPSDASNEAMVLLAKQRLDAAGRLADALHQDIRRARMRPAFMGYWQQTYNQWLSYRTLYADREVRSDPTRVAEQEAPKFYASLLRWRDALEQETGKPAKATMRATAGGESKARAEIPWRPVLAIGGVAIVALGAKFYLRKRQESKAREAKAAEVAQAQAAQAQAAQSQAMQAPLAWPAFAQPIAAQPPWAVDASGLPIPAHAQTPPFIYTPFPQQQPAQWWPPPR